MQCSFDGCEKPARVFGLCPGHYRQQKLGKPLKPLQVQYHGLSEYDRFFKWVKVGDGAECWNWQGSRNKVHWHGQWRNGDGEIELTHRAAWRLLRGELPKGAFVLHRCDNPICVNPSHLFIGSQSDNARDMWQKGRARPKSNIGENHGMTKIPEAAVRDIRTSKEPGTVLAARYDITATTVCDIRKRRTWKHID